MPGPIECVRETVSWYEAEFGPPPTKHTACHLRDTIQDAKKALADLEAQLEAQSQWESGLTLAGHRRYWGDSYEQIAAGLRAWGFGPPK